MSRSPCHDKRCVLDGSHNGAHLRPTRRAFDPAMPAVRNMKQGGPHALARIRSFGEVWSDTPDMRAKLARRADRSRRQENGVMQAECLMLEPTFRLRVSGQRAPFEPKTITLATYRTMNADRTRTLDSYEISFNGSGSAIEAMVIEPCLASLRERRSVDV